MREDHIQAERYSRQRAAYLPAFAIILIVQQGAFILGGGGDGRHAVFIGAVWMFMAATMLLVAMTGGWLFARRPIRELMNDEGTVAARRKSHSLGFINAMLVSVILYALTFLKDFTAREAIVIIFAMGLSSALLSFGFMERRALQND